jgi:hypothetical protein
VSPEHTFECEVVNCAKTMKNTVSAVVIFGEDVFYTFRKQLVCNGAKQAMDPRVGNQV